MDSFGNLDSRKFYKIDVWFHGPSGAQPRPHLRVPLKKGIGRVLRYGDVSPKNYSPTLHPQHLVENELWWNAYASWRYNCSLIFPTALSEPVAEPPASWQDGTQTIPEKKGKKKKGNLCFWEQTAEWRVLLAAAYKSPLTSEDTSGMVSGTLLPPQHFSVLTSNGREMPEWRASVHDALGEALGGRTRWAPDEGHRLAPSILSQKINEFWGRHENSFQW